MHLATDLEQLVCGVTALELRADKQRIILDGLADLHNDLTDWATNTEHETAALEVMAILEQHVQKTTRKGSRNGDARKDPAEEKDNARKGSENSVAAG